MRISLKFIFLILLCVALFGQSQQQMLVSAATYSLPSGVILPIVSGSCPAGTTENDSLAGVMLYGTTSANMDVGGTGGSNTVTPGGTNSTPTLAMNSYTPVGTNSTVSFTPAGTNATASFTPAGNNSAGTISWPAGVPTFSGASDTTSSVSAGTPAGTNGTATLSSVGTKMVTTSGTTFAFTTLAGTASAASANITVPAETFTGAALAGHTHTVTPTGTVAWPAGVPTVTADTFSGNAGTVPGETFTGTSGTVPAQTFTGQAATLTGSVSAPVFSGTPLDNRSAFVKVIFCQTN